MVKLLVLLRIIKYMESGDDAFCNDEIDSDSRCKNIQDLI